MKIPKRKMEKTTTKMEKLLFLRPFIIAPVSELKRGVLRRNGCMVEKRKKKEKEIIIRIIIKKISEQRRSEKR
jgi:hypothetical protein